MEAVLLVTGALDIPDRPPPKRTGGGGDEEDDEESSEDEGSSHKMRSAVTATNARHQKNVRSSGRKKGDSDSDFEFDI